MQSYIVSFEKSDTYSRAGGLAARVEGLPGTLAKIDLETHPWFIGDPDPSGHVSGLTAEILRENRGTLHVLHNYGLNIHSSPDGDAHWVKMPFDGGEAQVAESASTWWR